jgi:hypothetical protein
MATLSIQTDHTEFLTALAQAVCSIVCRTHNPARTKIVKLTTAKYAVPYQAHRTVWQVARHVSLLKRLGSEA